MMGREALCILTSRLIQRGFSPSPLTTECPLHPFTPLSKGLTAAVARCPRSCRLPRVLNAVNLTNCIVSYLSPRTKGHPLLFDVSAWDCGMQDPLLQALQYHYDAGSYAG